MRRFATLIALTLAATSLTAGELPADMAALVGARRWRHERERDEAALHERGGGGDRSSGLLWRGRARRVGGAVAGVDPVDLPHADAHGRAVGGQLFVIGALIMCYNLWMTVRAQPSRAAQPAAVPAE